MLSSLPECPVSLLGQDLLYKLRVTIYLKGKELKIEILENRGHL